MARLFSANDLLSGTVDLTVPVFLDTTSWEDFEEWVRDNLNTLKRCLDSGLRFWVFSDEISRTEPKLYRQFLKDKQVENSDIEIDENVEPAISFEEELESNLGIKFHQDKLPKFQPRELEEDEPDPEQLFKRFLYEVRDSYFHDVTDHETCDRHAEFVFLLRSAAPKVKKLRVLTAQPAFHRLANAEIFFLGTSDEWLFAGNSTKRSSVFGEPSTEVHYRCDVFMVMPFAPKFTPVYEQLVKPTVEELGLIIKRGDDPMTDKSIMHEVWSMINACKLVIADCTDLNANVFYEIGMAHSIGKQVITLIQDASQLPFDIRHRRAIVYSTSFDKVEIFKRQLKETIQTLLGLT